MNDAMKVLTEQELRDFLEGFGQQELESIGETYSWELDDLYFLYKRVRQTGATSVLEFGSGWSTLVLSLGLWENRSSMGNGWPARHPNPWAIMTVDVSSHWQQIALERIPSEYASLIVPVISECEAQLGPNGGIFSNFTNVPFFMPDLIYVDGPDPEQVKGEINGFSFVETHTLPMVGNLLQIENQLWPGTEVVFDGRTANARALSASLTRSWDYFFDPFGDRTLMRLDESSLGAVSVEHQQLRMLLSGKSFRKDGIVTP